MASDFGCWLYSALHLQLLAGDSAVAKEAAVSIWEHCNHKDTAVELPAPYPVLWSSGEKLFVGNGLYIPWYGGIIQVTTKAHLKGEGEARHGKKQHPRTHKGRRGLWLVLPVSGECP